jgi:cytoplasmic iron level regulating protein YaaA (DUF328/UPF0246 family)
MLMIISPSKTQNYTKSLSVETTQPSLLQDSELLIGELRELSAADLSKLMKISERLALQTFQRIKAFEVPFTPENACPAILAFQGDVYSKINIKEYGNNAISYMQNHLRVLSGLYGILRPLDLIQAYRLEMGCALVNRRGRNIYEFWGEKITTEVNRLLDGQKEPILVNLASNEYSRVINKKNLHGSLLQIDFKERKAETYRAVAIHAKRARGMMVDFAVKNRIKSAVKLQDFNEGAYSFHPELSKTNHYCFTRDMQ